MDTELVGRLGWEDFVCRRQGREDLTSMEGVHHPAAIILKGYHHWGLPAKLSRTAWTDKEVERNMRREEHKSAAQHAEFLAGEGFYSMVKLNQRVFLPYSVDKKIKILAIIPPGVSPQRNRQPR